MGRRRPVKLSKKEQKFRLKAAAQKAALDIPANKLKESSRQLKTVSVPKVVPIRKLSELAAVDAAKIIEVLFKNGVSATINQSIDFETAVLIGDELGLDIIAEKSDTSEKAASASSNLVPRPPVVTMMGHVDHGKTVLLDAIRHTNVAGQESGGITQHIGAYQVEVNYEGKKRQITFLDTPGHEAFSALRAHGASITDIVILVVAADDGVKPQTVEAITHAKAADVPRVVAINKIDAPGADIQRVKTQLSEQGLQSEDWGGKIPTMEISAKKKLNISHLLDIVLLTADLMDIKADPGAPMEGVVIESHMEQGVGAQVTALVSQGTVRPGQTVVVGKTYGKIKFMTDWQGNRIPSAGPSMPIIITGIKAVAKFGDLIKPAESEKSAQSLLKISRDESFVPPVSVKDSASEHLHLIIKADVAGSLEALKASIADLNVSTQIVDIISEGVGAVTESDVNLAKTARAEIFGFRVAIPKPVEKLADLYQINVKTYSVIYQLMDDLKSLIETELPEEKIINEEGKLKVLKVFYQTKKEAVIGCLVSKGTVLAGYNLDFFRGEEKIGSGKVESVKIGPSDVDEAKEGVECGIKAVKTSSSDGSFTIAQSDIIKMSSVVSQKIKL